jgi:hypothetical protein
MLHNITQECGILTEGGMSLEGPSFRKMTPAQLDDIMPSLQVSQVVSNCLIVPCRGGMGWGVAVIEIVCCIVHPFFLSFFLLPYHTMLHHTM